MSKILNVAFAALLILAQGLASARAADDGYTPEEIVAAATGFFGETTEGLATVVEKVFAELGRPNAYIAGEEASGAFFFGLRYGRGTLNRKAGGSVPVYWQGPSIGWDVGGNASKSFVLVYGLKSVDDIFVRFPGGEGTIYFVAGVAANYQQNGDIVLVPIRTGVGLRAGVNVGYQHYTREASVNPF